MQNIEIPPCSLDAQCERLRQEVREFLAQELADRTKIERMRNKAGIDPDFSRKLGARGWIGMALPKKYGGHERSALERYVITEELLAAGAPVGAHWIADRQYAPLLLRYGTEEMRQTLLPRIARGELYFCIGMSEPDSGSDLASVRTKAERTDRGWVINGRKTWNSAAHRSHYMVALVRTGPPGDDRHGGLSQFLIDLTSPGVSLRPINMLTGERHWSEVILDDVVVPVDHLLGGEGMGWTQVTTELGFERAGPERYLSSIHLVYEMLDAADAANPRHAVLLGRLVAEIDTLRRMSLGVAGMLSRGENPGLAASVVKDLGTSLEQQIPEIAHELFDMDLSARETPLEQMTAYLTQVAPAFSIRGGSREVLRGIIARGLGVR